MADEKSGRSALGMKRDISSRYVPYLLDRAVQPLVPFCETGGGSAFADWIHLMGTSSCHLSLERLIDISGSRGWSLVHRHSLISHPSTIIRSLVGQPTAKSTCVAPITHRARLSQCRSSNTSLESMYSLHQPCRLQTRPGYVGPLVLQSWVNPATLPTSKVFLHLRVVVTSRARAKHHPNRQRPSASYPLLLAPNRHQHLEPSHLAHHRSLSPVNLDHLPVWPTYQRFKMKRRKKTSLLRLGEIST
jgi:hypothetical protein